MSKHAEFDITPEEQAENEAFLRGREVAGERYIKRMASPLAAACG